MHVRPETGKPHTQECVSKSPIMQAFLERVLKEGLPVTSTAWCSLLVKAVGISRVRTGQPRTPKAAAKVDFCTTVVIIMCV